MRDRFAFYALLLILLLGAGLRVGFSLWRGADEASLQALPDQREYLECAREFGRGGEMRYFDARFGQWIYAARPPGYPMFIWLCGTSVRTVQLAQAGLDALTALAAFLLVKRLGLGRWSLLAAAGVSLNPLLIYFSSLLLTETLYTTLLTWAMVLLVGRQWLGGSLLLSLGVLVKTSGMPLALVLPLAAAATAGLGARRALAIGAVGVVVLVLTLWPWAERNRQVLGERVWLSSNGGITLYDGVHPQATGASDQRFTEALPEVASLGELERDRWFKRAAREAMAQDPMRMLKLAVVKAARTWSPVPLSESFGRRLYVVIGLVWSAPVFLLALAGAVVTLRQGGLVPRGQILLLLLPMLLLTLMHALSVGSLRYRMPVEPLLAVLAAAGVAVLLTRTRRDVRP